jgi:hypothetical protein
MTMGIKYHYSAVIRIGNTFRRDIGDRVSPSISDLINDLEDKYFKQNESIDRLTIRLYTDVGEICYDAEVDDSTGMVPPISIHTSPMRKKWAEEGRKKRKEAENRNNTQTDDRYFSPTLFCTYVSLRSEPYQKSTFDPARHS